MCVYVPGRVCESEVGEDGESVKKEEGRKGKVEVNFEKRQSFFFFSFLSL